MTANPKPGNSVQEASVSCYPSTIHGEAEVESSVFVYEAKTGFRSTAINMTFTAVEAREWAARLVSAAERADAMIAAAEEVK